MWLIGDVLMFYQFGLDPSTTHNVTLTASGVQTDFRFNSLVVFTPNNTEYVFLRSFASHSTDHVGVAFRPFQEHPLRLPTPA